MRLPRSASSISTCRRRRAGSGRRCRRAEVKSQWNDGMNQAPNLFGDGKAYEQLMGRWSRLAGEKFLDWLDAPKNLNWLDAGCGNGAFTEVLMARCAPASVVGIDPSEGQLAYARGRSGTKGADFRVADAQALPFPDNSFDAATMAL